MKSYLNGNRSVERFSMMLTLVLLSLCLYSCQKRPQMAVYTGSDTEKNPIAGLYVEDGDYQAALKRCQERLKQYQEDSIEAADVYSLMGDIYADYAGDREKAVFYLEKAIKIHQKAGNEIGLAQDYGGMAEVYINIDSMEDKGLEYLEKAEGLYRKNGLSYSSGLVAILSRKGQAYRMSGQYESSLVAFKEAQEINLKRQKESADIYLFAGQTYIDMKEYELAEHEFLEALRICIAGDNPYKAADAHWLLGDLYLEQQEYQQAIEFYEKSLEFYKSDSIYLFNEAFIYNSIAYTYNQSGELEQALEPAIRASRITENLKMNTEENNRRREIYKTNLELYYQEWTGDFSDDGYEKWYQIVVREGEDWIELAE